jgi:hypothetical protein
MFISHTPLRVIRLAFSGPTCNFRPDIVAPTVLI